MSNSQGTLVQKCGKTLAVTLTAAIVLLHVAAFGLAGYFCPSLFISQQYEGAHCQPTGETVYYNWSQKCPKTSHSIPSRQQMIGEGGCKPKSPGEVVRLQDLRIAFRFPRDQTYSPWNWRIVASLFLDIKVFEKEILWTDSNYNKNITQNISALAINDSYLAYPKQEIRLSASLDYAPTELLYDDGGDEAENEDDGEDCVEPSPWHSKAIVRHVKRTLSCQLGRQPNTSIDLQSSLTEVHYRCSVFPLLELLLVSNSSYIATVRIESSDASSSDTATSGDSPLPSTTSVLNLLGTSALLSSHLSVVTETPTYHNLVFYSKCFFSPLVLTALVWFTLRLCLRDLYISIPDRLLLTAGLAQVIADIPTEALLTAFPTPLITLLDPLAHLLLVTSVSLFWLVFSLDKLAVNEPWERSTRYYCRPISATLLAAAWAAVSLAFLKAPTLSNPFNSHWLSGQTTTYVSLGCVFSLAVLVAIYQTYLSVLIFRVICDISVSYPSMCRAWRLKGVMLYCLATSLLLCGGFILRQGVSLCLHWNQQFHTDPLPFNVGAAGAVYLAEIATYNIHIISLLVMLSRSSGSLDGWYSPVRPVMYSPTRDTEQLHLWDLSAHPSPLHK